MSHTAYNALVNTLPAVLGGRLIAAYSFPTSGDLYAEGTSAGEQLAFVLQTASDLHALRDALPSLPATYFASAGTMPLVATEAAFRRHLEIHPIFAAHLAATGRSLLAPPALHGSVEPADEMTQMAFFAHEAFAASAALVPERLPADEWAAAERLLRRLVIALTGQQPPATLPASALFAAVQMELARRLREAEVMSPGPDTEPAVYRLRERHAVIMPEAAPREWLAVTWSSFLERRSLPNTALHVATVRQMRAAISRWYPLDFALANLEHRFGSDPLNDIEYSVPVLARAVALKTSQQLVRLLPSAYLGAGDDEALHDVVHDYQNKLLNVRLQHELLGRVAGITVAAPEDALPGPDAPLAKRIEAILASLDQWTACYANLARSQPPSTMPAR